VGGANQKCQHLSTWPLSVIIMPAEISAKWQAACNLCTIQPNIQLQFKEDASKSSLLD